MFRLQRQTRSHYDALDAILTILYQQCSDMYLDLGQYIVELPCVECCVKLFKVAHTSACVCVSCICSSDALGFFAESFTNCRRSMRGRRVTATRELQHDTSVRKFFVLGALVPAMFLATWWVRPPSMTGGVGNPTTVVKWHSHSSRSVTHSFSGHTCNRVQTCCTIRVPRHNFRVLSSVVHVSTAFDDV